MKKIFILLIFIFYSESFCQPIKTISLKNECLSTLKVLCDCMLELQGNQNQSADFGALKCPEHNLFHSRAAEAVYPFAVLYKQTKNIKYSKAAISLGNWLIKQQRPTGEWLETPWTWTGTTADQLLMMSLAYPILEPLLSKSEKIKWKNSIIASADYLVKFMDPDFATINYCATTPASLMMTNAIFPDSIYVKKARKLSRMVLSKMNADGFIEGEAARVGKVKYGIDPAYEMDMSFWGLLLYAKMSKDSLVDSLVRKAVEEHLALVYPNGMIDGSWGARCYKWTTYGSKTADGSQILFGLLAESDARYRTAAWYNLEYLRTMIKNGMVGNGPQFFEMTSKLPCIYPTFARAKSLAMASELGDQNEGVISSLPSEEIGFSKLFPSVNVAFVRTENIYTTISAYHYIDQLNWGEGRYSQFPSGGSPCNIWVKDFGLFQTSSPTKYVRGEVIHMPELSPDSIRTLTPRIEYSDSGKYYTNLYERAPQMSFQKNSENDFLISVRGELKNELHLPGGVGYTLSHQINKSSIQKTIEIRYHDKLPEIFIIEPVVFEKGMEVSKIDEKTVKIKYSKKEFLLKIEKGNVQIELGKDIDRYWQPFPAMRCYPIVLKLKPPMNPFEDENYKREVSYEFVFN